MIVLFITVLVVVAFFIMRGTKYLPAKPPRKIKYGKDSSTIGTAVETSFRTFRQ